MRQRRLGLPRVQPHRAARAGLHREGRAADLGADVERGEEEEVAHPRRARAARGGDRHLAHVEPVLGLVRRGLLEQPLGRLPGGPCADMVDEAFADRQLGHRLDPMARSVGGADPAAQQDRRRAVRARGDDDGAGPQFAARR